MADYVIQFKYTSPEEVRGDIRKVHDAQDIVEAPSPTGRLAMIKITGLPEYIDREMLTSQLQQPYFDEYGNLTKNSYSKVLVENMSPFDQDLLENNRFIQRDYADVFPYIYSRILQRVVTLEDFSG